MKNFQIIAKLGEGLICQYIFDIQGTYSQVFKVKRVSDGQEYAMKKVRLGQLKEKEKENALNEIRILASIDHPYIVAFKDSFLDEQSYSLCIIMEYADGGDAQKKIDASIKNKSLIPESTIWKMLCHIVLALKTLHSLTIVHRDIKPANVFISRNGIYKLGDMNVSKVARRGFVQTQTGTPYYASPEVWRDEPYDAKSDIWSLGCVAYEMAALRPPFRAADMDGLYQRVQKGFYERIPSKYSSELMQIISICLQVNPSQRPNSEQLLNHPVFLKCTMQEQKASQLKQTMAEDQIDQNNISQEDLQERNVLLETIRVPKNLKHLVQKLPKPKYSDQNQSLDGQAEQSIDTSLKQLDSQISQLINKRGNQHSAYEQNRDEEAKINSSIKRSDSPRKFIGQSVHQKKYLLDVNKNDAIKGMIQKQKEALKGQQKNGLGGLNISADVSESNVIDLIKFNMKILDEILNQKLAKKQKNLLGVANKHLLEQEVQDFQLERLQQNYSAVQPPSIKYQNPEFMSNKQLRMPPPEQGYKNGKSNASRNNNPLYGQMSLLDVQKKFAQNQILKEAENAVQPIWWE